MKKSINLKLIGKYLRISKQRKKKQQKRKELRKNKKMMMIQLMFGKMMLKMP